jgi:hypothetical protein
MCAALTGLVLLAAPARAQTAPVPVFFFLPGEDWRTKPLADSIRAALARAPNLKPVASAVPGALTITVPDGLGEVGHEDRIRYSFTVRFSRDGVKIGDSVQSCKTSALEDCADQIAADAQSAADMTR